MIRLLIHVYILMIIVDAILSYWPKYRVAPWALNIKKATDFSLNPIRKILPQTLPYDISPLVAIIMLILIMALW